MWTGRAWNGSENGFNRTRRSGGQSLRCTSGSLASLQTAATGVIEPPPSRITFRERGPNRVDLTEEHLESGNRAILIQVRSIREGLEWLAQEDRIPTGEIPTLERELELELKRERDRGITR